MGIQMQDNRMLHRLEVVFRWLGYFMLGSTLFIVFSAIQQFARTDIVMADGITPANTDLFFFLPHVIGLIRHLTQAFFLLLVAQIFSLLMNSAEKKYDYGDRLMIVTSIGFLLQGAVGFISWVELGNSSNPIENLERAGGYYYMVAYVLSGFSQLLTPTLYAVTIFVLYRHFVRMVNFESEVV
jgi:hypothetical protein